MTTAPTLNPADFKSTPAPGRACGTCTLCCKVFDVPSLQKPMGKWCTHCLPGRGCAIHETRPEHCRAFHCLWMLSPMFSEDWKPERCKFVMTVDPTTNFLLVQVDPGSPTAWRAEPYYTQFKRWAEAGLAQQRQVIIFINKRATVVLPRQDLDVGIIEPGDRIVLRVIPSPHGDRFEAEKVRA